ncbi:MAG: hypothetical protein VB853_02420 [Pirellulales bacterium]
MVIKRLVIFVLVFSHAPLWGEDKIPRPKPVAPPGAEAVEASIRRGVDFLLLRQNKDGSWGTARRTKNLNIVAPVPGSHWSYRAATTALAVSALLETGDPRAEVGSAIDRGEAWLLEWLPKIRRGSAGVMYSVWAHAYGIQALVRMHGRDPDDRRRRRGIEKQIAQQIDLLARDESVGGGWGYYNFLYNTQKPVLMMTSFTSATVLIAFAEAKQIGIDVPQKLVDAGLHNLRLQQKPDFSYLYHEGHWLRPLGSINRPGGSLGRSQVCNLALRLWGDKKITDQVMIDWLDRLVARNLWLDIGRKRPIPHESHFKVAGYFYYYGHYYAAYCVEQLAVQQRSRLKDHLAVLMLKHQDKDGCWWDYPLFDYHQQYGTAFAVMTLVRCRHNN